MSTGIINIELYERQDLIHQGEKSKIIEIIDKKNVKYAAKILSLVEIEELSRYKLIEISRGLNNILKFNHPSILKFLGYSPVNFKGRSKPVMITEFAANRSLDKILNSDDHTKLDDTKITNHTLRNCLGNVIFTRQQYHSSRFTTKQHFS